DCGTIVYSEANLKSFMTVSQIVRAELRYAELMAKCETITMEEVIENLAHRDHIDSTREESPLRQAADAFVLDNSDLTQEEQLQIVLEEYKKRKDEQKGEVVE